jgi:hypothetical protein
VLTQAAKVTKVWHVIDFNDNQLVSLAEIDKLMVQDYPLLNHKPALMRAYKQTCCLQCLKEGGDGDACAELAEFPMLLDGPRGDLDYLLDVLKTAWRCKALKLGAPARIISWAGLELWLWWTPPDVAGDMGDVEQFKLLSVQYRAMVWSVLLACERHAASFRDEEGGEGVVAVAALCGAVPVELWMLIFGFCRRDVPVGGVVVCKISDERRYLLPRGR